MEDRSLLLIAFFVGFLGLGALLFIQDSVDVEVSSLEDLSVLDSGDYVKIIGEVYSYNALTGMYIFELTDGKEYIKVVVFAETPLYVRKGDYLSVEGELEEYKGENEVIASKIVIL